MPRPRIMTKRITASFILLAIMAMVDGCSNRTIAPAESEGYSSVYLHADLEGTSATSVVVEVSAPGALPFDPFLALIGATFAVSVVLLAGLQLMLSRFNGHDDVVVGTPIANRQRVETEKLIGCFINTLALRADLGGDPSFVELLGRVQQEALGGYAQAVHRFLILPGKITREACAFSQRET